MKRDNLSPSARRNFRKKVYDYFRRHKRDFSWRKTRDPYRILVSEVMLQQTQTDRVEKKLKEFLAAFPEVAALDRAPLHEVLRVWQGMGYNRRALYLKRAAGEIVRRHGGALPRSLEALQELPGIGPATARSIAAFAFNDPVVFIETNIRTVYLHEFFQNKQKVTDAELLPLVEQTLDAKDPRRWYNALMDYGTMLKARAGNTSRQSAHYKKQSPFQNSDRKVRGEIIRRVSQKGAMTGTQLCSCIDAAPERIERCLRSLLKDGLLARRAARYSIP